MKLKRDLVKSHPE